MLERLARLYRNDPRGYLAVVGLAIAGGACMTGFFWGILAARTYGVEPGAAVIPVLVSTLAWIPTAALTAWIVRDDGRVLIHWVLGDGPRDELARAELLVTALRLPWRAVRAVLVAGSVVAYPVILGAFATTTTFDFDDVLLGVGGGALGVIYAAAYLHTTLELTLRPLRLDLGASVSRDARARIGSFSLIARVLIGLAVSSVVLGFVGGILIAPADSSFVEGARIVAVAVGVTAVVGGTLAVPLARGVLGPVYDLVAATKAVGAGDLETEVPLTSADELGDLVVSFNEMVDGLREREALRSHNDELVEELRASRARIVAASTEARRRVERDLHDGAQQSLVLLNLKLGLLEKQLEGDPAAREMASEARGDLATALDELRDLAHGIYPAVLTSDGLPGALAEAVEQAPIDAALDCDGIVRYSPETEAAVYFCCLEALQNAVKHAGHDARVNVHLRQRDDRLEFEIADDGAGFDPARAIASESAGLQNIDDRIGALGGAIRIESAPGAGTRVAGRLPLAG